MRLRYQYANIVPSMQGVAGYRLLASGLPHTNIPPDKTKVSLSALDRYLGTTLAENPGKAKFLTPAEQLWLQRRNAAQKVRMARVYPMA